MYQLSEQIVSVERIFSELLQLQLKFPYTGRFHFLFESQNSTVTTNAARRAGVIRRLTSVDLFSIFSPTVSTESHERRDKICTIGGALVYFKHISDSDRKVLPMN